MPASVPSQVKRPVRRVDERGVIATARTRGAHDALHLTFDDGPDGRRTVDVLHALRDAGATATFFVTPGREAGLVQTILDEGHDVAYHCRQHRRHSERTETEVREELLLDLAWLGAMGVRPHGWRTPWGDLARWTSAMAVDNDLQLWGWSHDTEDWAGHGAEAMLTRFGDGLTGGEVVLMHDGIGPGARRHEVHNTVELIGPLCAMARDHGLRVVPLP